MTRHDAARIAGLILLAALVPARARAQAGGDDLPTIRITDPNRDLYKLAVPRADGEPTLAHPAGDLLARDLDIVGIFRLLDPAGFPQALVAEGLGFSSANWSQVGAQGVVKLRVTREGLEGRLYQIGRGEAAVLTRAYRLGADGDASHAVHAFANDVVEHFTGQPGVFGSRIAFAQTGKGAREIASVEMDGLRLGVLTHMNSDCLLPAYSLGGGEVAFTSYLRGNPDLWVVAAGGGRARRVSQKPGMNAGAAWAPDGRTLAVTLSFDGNPEIYRIDAAGNLVGRLTNSPAMDLSPSWSPDGAQIAFVSNRQGSPQIFVMPASGGGAKRITFQGKYNQTPKWNPRGDKPLIAFTGRDERGVFDIYVIDMRTGKVDRVTQDQGSNFDPSWSPDGRLLVYASSRGGLWVANPETRHEVQIMKGGAASPSWGPAPRR